MSEGAPIKVAVIGGGCASIAAAFELSRPEHNGKYEITVYQLGWRLGGKGASGRGPADRIEEHGLHVWMGFYENAFRLLRECYAELNRDPRECRFADWRDAFTPEPIIGVMDRGRTGRWNPRISSFPPADGVPGDPLTDNNPFSVSAYLLRSSAMARVLVSAAALGGGKDPESAGNPFDFLAGVLTPEAIADAMTRMIKYGLIATTTGLLEALNLVQMALTAASKYSDNLILRLLEIVASSARALLEPLVNADDEARWLWEITDLLLATMTGIVRFGLLTDPRGFDAIDEFDITDWLRMNGASEGTLKSAMLRGCYDLAFAYEDGQRERPAISAGQGLRGALRMFFTYRGSIFWKMRAGMGDIVFAPFYQVLKRRGVSFRFFHRLTNVRLAKSHSSISPRRDYVEALEFDVQAKVKDGDEYQPLIDVSGVPCWPSQPDFGQLVEGDQIRAEHWDFESYWEDRKAGTKILSVTTDFDVVVLGVGLGAIPYVCREIVDVDRRWYDMITYCRTVATQSFQIWMREDVEQLGWRHNQCTVTAFQKPFDTWADMRHLIAEERWSSHPRGIAYFCGVLPDCELPRNGPDREYLAQCRDKVKRDAVDFLNREAMHLWPNAARRGGFRWDLLLDPARPNEPVSPDDESVFDTQYWSANVNPSDRYCLSLPGTARFRISPLDNTYDNLTVAGDWTDCGFNEGCVEAAVMSGRLAAHAISGLPCLDGIVGYDHP